MSVKFRHDLQIFLNVDKLTLLCRRVIFSRFGNLQERSWQGRGAVTAVLFSASRLSVSKLSPVDVEIFECDGGEPIHLTSSLSTSMCSSAISTEE
jgi:hypothetical protein